MATFFDNSIDPQDVFAEAFFPTIRLHGTDRIEMKTKVKMAVRKLTLNGEPIIIVTNHENVHTDSMVICSWIEYSWVAQLETIPDATNINLILSKNANTILSNEAIDKLFNSMENILHKDFDSYNKWLGGRLLVTPVCAIRNTELNSANRLEELLKHINSVVSELYVTSQYQAAYKSQHSDEDVKPTVVIGCDSNVYEAISAHIVNGMLSLDNGFYARVVSTSNERMVNNLFIVFNIFDASTNIIPNPLNFGNMIWCEPSINVCNIIIDTTKTIYAYRPILKCMHLVNMPVIGYIKLR